MDWVYLIEVLVGGLMSGVMYPSRDWFCLNI